LGMADGVGTPFDAAMTVAADESATAANVEVFMVEVV
jgi:hypothetical protein